MAVGARMQRNTSHRSLTEGSPTPFMCERFWLPAGVLAAVSTILFSCRDLSFVSGIKHTKGYILVDLLPLKETTLAALG